MVGALIHQRTHRVADMNLAGKDDEALTGTAPYRFLGMTEGIPGKDAVAISQQQTVDAQVATDRKRPVVIGQTRIGEPEFLI